MGGIWRPSGRAKWRIWYKDHNGRRCTAPGFKDKRATEAKLQTLERTEERIAAGILTPEEAHGGGKRPLTDLIVEYIADLRRQGTSLAHRVAQQGFLVRLARWEKWSLLGHVRHAAMTTALVHLDERGYAPRSVNHYRKAWKCLLGWCCDNGLIGENPLLKVKASLGQESPKRKRAPTMDEWLKLLEVVPRRRRLVYFVAGLTGLRLSECRDLEARDVVLDHDPPQLRLRVEATKARRADTVPLLPDVVPVLRELCDGLAPTDRLFVPMPAQKTIRGDIARAGIISPDSTGRYVSFHSLRYFFATLIARTLPIGTVRLLMRHKDISTTFRIYVDLGLQDVADQVQKLPSFLPAHPLAHNCPESTDGRVMPKRRSGKRA